MENEWLKKYVKVLRISEIEKEIGCPKFTLTKYISGERSLPVKWIVPFDEYIFIMCKSGIITKREGKIERIEVVSGSTNKLEVIEQFEIDPSEVVERFEKAVKEDGYTVPKPMIGGIVNPSEHFKLKKIKEKKNEVSVPIDMTMVDVSTGEIKEKLKPIRIKWLFNRVEASYEVVEPWISKSGNLYEVKRIFGSIAKYVYVNNLEDARRIVEAKNPLLVELSSK